MSRISQAFTFALVALFFLLATVTLTTNAQRGVRGHHENFSGSIWSDQEANSIWRPPIRGHPELNILYADSESSSYGSTKGNAAAAWAKKQVGKCYSQAANLRYGPKCFDCSGLVYMAWKKGAGVDIGATWTGAYPGKTRKVSKSQIQPGDILHKTGHVGMYIGGGQVVNAENPKNGVRIRPLSSFKYTSIYRPVGV